VANSVTAEFEIVEVDDNFKPIIVKSVSDGILWRYNDDMNHYEVLKDES
jgi:hypothetical protein